MTEDEYRTQIQSIFTLSTLVRTLNIAGVLEDMRRAKALGPILDPTTYCKAAISLEWQIRVAEAALQFQQKVEQIASDPRYSFTGGKEP